MSIRTFVGAVVRKIIGERLYLRRRLGMRAEHFFLRKVRGIIHVGANEGQEWDLYAIFGLNVIWIEPIPEVFRTLKRNISAFPLQQWDNFFGW